MVKKSGVGKLPGDGAFKPKKIPKFGEARQSNRTSFRVPKPDNDLRKLDDKCGFVPVNDSQDLLEKRGRKTGELYLPDPVEVTNYNSQAIRYDRSLDLEIDKIYQDNNGRTIYAFCSKNSPSGFWEVSSISGTFLDIPNPNLTIICPRPFTAAQLLGTITTDGTSFRWSQLQGRTTIISPSEGDIASGVLNPTFMTIGVPSTFDPPILLLLELLDNPLIFRIVQIVTTPTSDNFGKDVGQVMVNIAPEFKVIEIIPAPSRLTGASVYRGEQISFTWNLPINNEFLRNFSLLQNTTGTYTPLTNVSINNRLFAFDSNAYYQIRSNYQDLFDSFQADSDSFVFQFPIDFTGRIFADDTINSKAASVCNEQSYIDYLLQVIDRTGQDVCNSKAASVCNEQSYIDYLLQVIDRTGQDVCNSKAASVCNDTSYTNYQLGGIVIG